MQIVSCPTCGNPSLDPDGHCARCGKAARASKGAQPLKEGHTSQDTSSEGVPPAHVGREEDEESLEWIEAGPTVILSHKTLQSSSEAPREPMEEDFTLKLTRKPGQKPRETPQELTESTLNLKRMRQGARAYLEADMLTSFEEIPEEEQDDEVIEGHSTWQKVIEPKTGHAVPAVVSFSSGSGIRRYRWPPLQPGVRRTRMFFWLSTLVLCALVLAGGFGMAIGFGHDASRTRVSSSLSLQAAPTTVALGGIVTLRGAHFTPGSQVILSRDQYIPIVDTGGAGSVQADAHGSFSDTIIIDPAWLAGAHVLYATDAHTRRQTLFRLLVTGQNVLQGPPRLLLSANALNLGAGDEATNGSKMLALSNAGGGELTWQAKVNQSWLQISPTSGSILSGSHLSAMVAVDRSGLAPGLYHTSILFISNTEQVSLAVAMTVTPLQPNHEAVLQISSAALAFSGSAEGADPQAQIVAVSNSGIRALPWGASISTQNAAGWLWMTPQNGSIEPGGQQQIMIGVTTQNLLPGVYKGEISFSNQGAQPIQGSPQVIYVSLTITPACVLTFAPGSLNFTGVHGGASPGAQSLTVNVAQGCATSQNWSASVHTISGGNWLQLSQASAATPSALRVSVNTSGLEPGIYTGTLTFTVNTGPQIVPVTLTISPLPCVISGAAELALQGTAGQTNSSAQIMTLTTSGDCPHTLNWTSTISSGATWLSATPAGTLAQPGTASVNVQASLAGLNAGIYSATLTITAVDSATGRVIGTVQSSVTLTVVQPPMPCTLQTPSTSTPIYTASAGSTTTQIVPITIGAAGNCSGNVTITSSSDSNWLSAGSPVTISSGGTATVTMTINPASLAANTYTSTITLSATDNNGAISGSPQTMTITLTVQ